MSEELILTCRKCGATHLITPPTKKLKKTSKIELNCYRCNYKNNYNYAYEYESMHGILTKRTRKLIKEKKEKDNEKKKD